MKTLIRTIFAMTVLAAFSVPAGAVTHVDEDMFFPYDLDRPDGRLEVIADFHNYRVDAVTGFDENGEIIFSGGGYQLMSYRTTSRARVRSLAFTGTVSDDHGNNYGIVGRIPNPHYTGYVSRFIISVSIPETENQEYVWFAHAYADPLARAFIADEPEPEVPGILPQISVLAQQPVITEGSVAHFKVSATSAPEARLELNVRFNTEGDFFNAEIPASLALDAGTYETFKHVQTTGDELDESNGSVTMTILPGNGYEVAMSSATVVINDDDEQIIEDPIGGVVPEEEPTLPFITMMSPQAVAHNNPNGFVVNAVEGDIVNFVLTSDTPIATEYLDVPLRIEYWDGRSLTPRVEFLKGDTTATYDLSVPDNDAVGPNPNITVFMHEFSDTYKTDPARTFVVKVADDDGAGDDREQLPPEYIFAGPETAPSRIENVKVRCQHFTFAERPDFASIRYESGGVLIRFHDTNDYYFAEGSPCTKAAKASDVRLPALVLIEVPGFVVAEDGMSFAEPVPAVASSPSKPTPAEVRDLMRAVSEVAGEAPVAGYETGPFVFWMRGIVHNDTARHFALEADVSDSVMFGVAASRLYEHALTVKSLYFAYETATLGTRTSFATARDFHMAAASGRLNIAQLDVAQFGTSRADIDVYARVATYRGVTASEFNGGISLEHKVFDFTTDVSGGFAGLTEIGWRYDATDRFSTTVKHDRVASRTRIGAVFTW